MTYVAVLPSIFPPWTERCMRNCELRPVHVIDNTVHNIGVAASWNRGIDEMQAVGADWLVIMSAALRFGDAKGLDFAAALEDNAGAVAIEAHHGIGWHLIAFSRDIIERVGRFDENYYPAYMEDLDFAHRIHCVRGIGWPKVSVDVAIAGFAHGLDLGGVIARHADLKAYYLRKWGSTDPAEQWCQPFGDKPIDYWPPR